MKPRIGLLGGTFDPIHMGHLQIAELAQRLCVLQEVRFIPAAVPPHKNSQVIASFNDRATMIQLALAGCPDFKLSTVEASLPVPSYTIDTLKYFHDQAMVATDFFFLMGADAFLDIVSWKSYRQVLQAAHFVVVDRPGAASCQVKKLIARLGYMPEDSSGKWCHLTFQKYIFFPSSSIVDISSSLIRQKIKADISIEGLVPPATLEYIYAHDLYR